MSENTYSHANTSVVEMTGEPFKGGREPPGGDGMEARVAKLESDVSNIKDTLSDVKADIREMRADLKSETAGLRADMRTDFRITFGALITVALGLAALMAKGFGWL
ncbi:hypothetical protein [Martelella sp. FOR1707]